MEKTITAVPSRNEGAASNRESRAGKYLTFYLGTEEFGVRVMEVREIIGIQDITTVPQTPPYVKGVINLRGKVTPVICLRQKFGMPEAQFTQRTCLIVVQIQTESGPVVLGTIVDSVAEVVTLSAAEIEDTPDFGNAVQMPYVLGMAKTKGRVRILLDIHAALNTPEVQGLDSLSRAA